METPEVNRLALSLNRFSAMNAIALAAADRIAATSSLAAYRTFEMLRVQGGREALTDRERLALQLTAKMRSPQAWEKAGEWVADGGLFSKVRGVVKTPGAQIRLAQLNDWIRAYMADNTDYGLRVDLVIEENEIKVVLVGHHSVEIGWLNPKYAPALIPFVRSGQLTCTIERITGTTQAEGILGLNIRLDIAGLMPDDIATYEVATRRARQSQAQDEPQSRTEHRNLGHTETQQDRYRHAVEDALAIFA